MRNRILSFLLIGFLTTAGGTKVVAAQNALNVVQLDVGMLYVYAWDTHGPGLEASMGFSLPGKWAGMHHDVALVAQWANTHGTVVAVGPYDRSFGSVGAAWRSTLVGLGRRVKPYLLVPVSVVRSGLQLGDEFGPAMLSSTMEYRDLPDPRHWGTHWGLCFGLGTGLELDISRFLHLDVSGTLMYPTVFEDRSLIKTVRFGLAFGGVR